MREIGRELGVSHETLRSWVNVERRRREAANSGGGVEAPLSVDERAELRRLRKKLAEAELEKEILRKAAQYFAKEMGR